MRNSTTLNSFCDICYKHNLTVPAGSPVLSQLFEDILTGKQVQRVKNIYPLQ